MSDLELASNICGWLFVAAWGAMAYPQIILNFRLKSVEGFKLDYPFLNFSGLLFCSIAYSFVFFTPNLPFDSYGYGKLSIQDLVFVYHNLFVNLILNVQALIYERGQNKLSTFSKLFVIFAWVSVGVFYLCFQVYGVLPSSKEVNVFIYLGYLKVFTSLTKYAPLAYWNYIRKSTQGFSGAAFFFDMTGASFAISQEVIDYIDGTTETINPVKIILGLVSISYDLVLFYQHFFLYRKPRKDENKKFWVPFQ